MPRDLNLIFTRDFVLITLVNLLVMSGDYQFFVTSALYSMRLFNAHLSEAGAVSGLMVLGCFIGRFFTGFLINVFGCLRTLSFSLVLLALTSGGVFFCTSLILFALERFMYGVSIGCAGTAIGTMVAYCIPPAVQGLGISLFSLSTALSLAIGPFIALTLTNLYGPDAVNGLVFALSALPLLAVFFLTNPQSLKPASKSFFALDNYLDKRVLKFSIVAFIVPIGYGCISAYLAAMCEERGIAGAAGLFFLVVAIVTILSRPISGRLFDLIGENIVVYPAIVFAALTLFILSVASSYWMVLLAAVCHGLGLSNFQSSGQALALKLVDRSRYAQATSTFFILWDLSLGVTPAFFGYIAHAAGFTVMFTVLGAVVLSGAVVYFFVHGKDYPLKRPLLKRNTNTHLKS